MIPKLCPLKDKAKLQTTLTSECLLEKVSDILEFCKECPYSAKNKRENISNVQYEELFKHWVKLLGLRETEKNDTEDVSDKR